MYLFLLWLYENQAEIELQLYPQGPRMKGPHGSWSLGKGCG